KALSDSLTPAGFRMSRIHLATSTIFLSFLSLSLPVLTLQVYDRILPNPHSGTLPVLIGGVCLAVMLEIALRLSRSYMLSFAGASYEHQMSCKAMAHVLKS